ncbi:MAG: DNA topoisomerase [Phycisphaerales bacterium]
MAKRPATTSKGGSKASAAGSGVADAPFDATEVVETKSKAATKEKSGGGGRGSGGGKGKFKKSGRTFASYTAGSAKGKDLVIVESPSKAKTINKYLGGAYHVMASVGHVRDLPSRNPKGVKSPVPGVDLEHDFKPTYVVSEDKEKVVTDLKRAAKDATGSGGTVWFATDLDREGEAIAWHLAAELAIKPKDAKRVVFAAITKAEIDRAFNNPHPIDEDRVNAQQARRILDRIVGYQASPLLWKKVARGLSAGRVQSVATRLIVEREREIRAFVPDEYWMIEGVFTPELAKASGLAESWATFMARRDDKGNAPTIKSQNAWLGENGAFSAELIEVDGEKFDPRILTDKIIGPITEFTNDNITKRLAKAASAFASPSTHDITPGVLKVAQMCGLQNAKATIKDNPKGRGPDKHIRTIRGTLDANAKYEVQSLETKRTTQRPPPPFITSSMQATAASRLGFAAQRTMRTAQQLYEGIDIPGEGPTGLITYMRTDSTHISGEALNMARGYIEHQFGKKYLPEKPNFYTSSNKDAQEAHEAIRPTSIDFPPSKVRRALNDDQFRLYSLIWERFIACQMVPAEWDSTTVLIKGGVKKNCTFRTSGRVLVFDGFYKVSGIPTGGDQQNLPTLKENQQVAPFGFEVEQKFTSPPSRYSESSLIKTLESEGIGRPSTYASIISVIQDRNYVEKQGSAFYSTDLGEVVTDKLVEAFPDILEVGYTREMETQLDKIEEDHLDWVDMLKKFYGDFTKDLKLAETTLTHAKAETVPAPAELTCPTCAKEGRGDKVGLVYRFGKNGRFLSCSKYPDCKYAAQVDREGKPVGIETCDVACPKCGAGMTKRLGRFGAFLGCANYGNKEKPCDGILNIDRKGKVTAPSQPPLLTDLPCPTCDSPMNLRNGLRGPWLGCSKFPKCRGRGKWNEVAEDKKKQLEVALKNHDKANPIPIIKTLSGKPLTDNNGKPLATAPTVEQLEGKKKGDAEETLESVAEEMGV